MDQQQVDLYIQNNQKNLPPERIEELRAMLLAAPDDKFQVVSAVQLKDTTTMLIIAILLGGWGLDRFMLGDVGLGVAKLLTAGGCLVWTVIDAISAQKRTQDFNFNNITAALQ